MKKTKWSFYQVFNLSVDEALEWDRKLEKRDRIWASELGQSMADRFLKMRAVEPSNPPNPRSRRKMATGRIWEWIVEVILRQAGILIDSQKYVVFKYDGLPKVTGKMDFLAGGKPDWEKAKADLGQFNFPDFILASAIKMTDKLEKLYPDGMDKVPLEIKSCSVQMFDNYERNGTPSLHHSLQAFHYTKGGGFSESHLVYISRGDCRLIEFGVFNPSQLEEVYRDDIKTLWQYLKSNKQPPLEPEVIFDGNSGTFKDNWKIKYSDYLTMLYGYKNQKEYEDKYRPLCARWNRVAKRVKEGKDMTKANLEVIKEIRKEYPDFEEVVKGK